MAINIPFIGKQKADTSLIQTLSDKADSLGEVEFDASDEAQHLAVLASQAQARAEKAHKHRLAVVKAYDILAEAGVEV